MTSEPPSREGRADNQTCDTSNPTHEDNHKIYYNCRGKFSTSFKRSFVNISATFLCFLVIYITKDPSRIHVQSLKSKYGSITVISAKPCQNALGQFGTCMFMWDCIKSEGVHLGTCSDRFLFGSCCHHSTPLALTLPADNANQRLNSSSALTGQSSSASFNYSEESHSRPSNNLQPTGGDSNTIALISTPATQTTMNNVNSATSFKPDRLFLSSVSSSSANQLDYVTTSPLVSSTSNSIPGDHAVHSNYDLSPNQSLVSTGTRAQQLSNNKLHTALTHNDWTMSVETDSTSTSATSIASSTTTTTTTTSSTTTSTTTTSTTTTTTTTPAPVTDHQLSGQSSWHQAVGYVSGGGGSNAPSDIINNYPSTQGESIQAAAVQSMNRPNYVSQATSPRPASSSNSPASLDVNQTQKPASSWLSRPSLLANAIFHSFKPYLNPIRQRPTYRPYMGGGFRPQHQPHRPLLAQQQQQQQRPQVFLPNTLTSASQQSISIDTIGSSGSISGSNGESNDMKGFSNFGSTQGNKNSSQFMSSASANQIENSDHHIVNPSTMTDRRRPIDQANQHQNNMINTSQSGDLMTLTTTNSTTSMMSASSEEQQKQQNDASHYDLYNGNDNRANSTKVPTSNQTSPELIISSLAATSDYSATSSSPTSTNGYATDLASNWTSSTASSIGLVPQAGFYDYVGGSNNNNNNNQQTSQDITNNSLTSYQHHALNQDHNQLPSNESLSGPSYPLVNPGFVAGSPIPDSSPIEEIHGLTDGNGHYELPDKQQSPQQQQNHQSTTMMSINGTLSSHLDSTYTIPNGNIFSIQPNRNSTQISPDINPPNNIMISNTQTQQLTPTSVSGVVTAANPVASTLSSSMVPTTGSAPQPPDVSLQLSTTTPTPIPSRLNHHHQQQQQHHTHNNHPIVSAAGGIAQNKEATCGVTALYPQTKVVGGKNAAFGAWPWQVSVRKVSFFGFSSTHRCGGAVISSEWIATAGHCVEDLALQSIRIRVGEYDFSTMAEPYPHIERGARKKVVHPKYNFYTYENDLALVQLDQPLQFSPHVAPICLPPDNIDLVGRNATVTGWGRLNEGGTLPTILQEVIVPIVSNDKCRDMFLRAGRPEYIPDIFLCAGYEEGGRDSCQGDSGGPLQVKGDDGRWVLAGIISWGIGCAEPLLVGVCSAIQRFKPWIQSTISGTS